MAKRPRGRPNPLHTPGRLPSPRPGVTAPQTPRCTLCMYNQRWACVFTLIAIRSSVASRLVIRASVGSLKSRCDLRNRNPYTEPPSFHSTLGVRSATQKADECLLAFGEFDVHPFFLLRPSIRSRHGVIGRSTLDVHLLPLPSAFCLALPPETRNLTPPEP